MNKNYFSKKFHQDIALFDSREALFKIHDLLCTALKIFFYEFTKIRLTVTKIGVMIYLSIQKVYMYICVIIHVYEKSKEDKQVSHVTLYNIRINPPPPVSLNASADVVTLISPDHFYLHNENFLFFRGECYEEK
ncbi:MAG: hypothetical protein LBT13_01620 [Treponema sp.]|nr:hypothetical protein [Treponema sp.]